MANKKTTEQIKANEGKDTSISRRSFLKRTAYVSPSLIVLGALSKPVTALGSVVDTTNTDFTGGGNGFGGNGNGPGGLGN